MAVLRAVRASLDRKDAVLHAHAGLGSEFIASEEIIRSLTTLSASRDHVDLAMIAYKDRGRCRTGAPQVTASPASRRPASEISRYPTVVEGPSAQALRSLGDTLARRVPASAPSKIGLRTQPSSASRMRV
jgi:hypothetical protein